MKRFRIVFPLAVFALLAVMVWLERPTKPGTEGFGFDTARPDPLPPLAMPRGELALAGRVEHADGRPAEDVLVTLSSDGADPSAEPLFWTYTAADGGFALDRLPAGTHRVFLVHASAPPTSLEVTLPAEGPVTWKLASALEPLPGLPEMRRRELTGAVVRPSTLAAQGLAGFEVVLRPTAENALLSGAAVRRLACDASGRFGAPDLVAAAYSIEVLPPWARGGSWPVLGRGSLASAADASTELRLALAVGELEGAVHEPSGRPLEGALVKLAAVDALDALRAAQTWPPAVTDADGRFRFTDLPASRFRLELRAGLDSQTIEVEVKVGEITSLAPVAIDPRGGDAPVEPSGAPGTGG